MSHEAAGKTDEWYTPKYIFDALGCKFDLDVAAPEVTTHVPANKFITSNSLDLEWNGFIWMNPPYGNQKVKFEWLQKFFEHDNGIALMPDRTSAPWWQYAAKESDCLLFVAGKIKFLRPDGSVGESPSNGTTLFGKGKQAYEALCNASKNKLGTLLCKL